MNKSGFLTKIDQTSELLDIKPGVILNFLKLLIQQDKITISELLYELEIPRTHFGRLMKSLSEFLTPKLDLVTLNEPSKKGLSEFILAENHLDSKEFEAKYLEIYSEIIKYRNAPKRDFDQFYATAKTVINRAINLHNSNELYRRKILLLGDDDLTSVALALINTANKIQVVDIDSSILETIEKIAKKYNLSIETSLADFRTANLDFLKNRFDVIFTDPPYTLAGIELFVDKGLRCLKFRNSSSLYFCYGNSNRATERTLSIQKLIIEKNLMISSIIDNFNQYTGADSIGNGSSLYKCVLTPLTKIPKSEKKYKGIYTNS